MPIERGCDCMCQGGVGKWSRVCVCGRRRALELMGEVSTLENENAISTCSLHSITDRHRLFLSPAPILFDVGI